MLLRLYKVAFLIEQKESCPNGAVVLYEDDVIRSVSGLKMKGVTF